MACGLFFDAIRSATPAGLIRTHFLIDELNLGSFTAD
jgi:hypothetical protein